MTTSLFPIVVFNVTDANSGNFSPVAQSNANSVTIWAKTKPTAAITIQIAGV